MPAIDKPIEKEKRTPDAEETPAREREDTRVATTQMEPDPAATPAAPVASVAGASAEDAIVMEIQRIERSVATALQDVAARVRSHTAEATQALEANRALRAEVGALREEAKAARAENGDLRQRLDRVRQVASEVDRGLP